MDLGKIILEATKQVNQTPEGQKTDVITGRVQTVNPLTIKISDKLTIGESNLILSATVKETWINIPTTHGEDGADGVFMHRHQIVAETELANDGQGADHKHAINVYTEYALPKILLWRGLTVGDMVYMLRVGQGQTYFVLERVEGVTNEN